MQPPYFIPATQCVLHLALRCVGQAAYKLLRSTSATSSTLYSKMPSFCVEYVDTTTILLHARYDEYCVLSLEFTKYS